MPRGVGHPSRSSGTATTTAGAGFSFRDARSPLRKPCTPRTVISAGTGGSDERVVSGRPESSRGVPEGISFAANRAVFFPIRSSIPWMVGLYSVRKGVAV